MCECVCSRVHRPMCVRSDWVYKGLWEFGYMRVIMSVCNSYSMVTMVNTTVYLEVAKEPGWCDSVVGCPPVNQEVVGSIPIQGTGRSCRLDSPVGACGLQLIDVSLSSMILSL